MQSERQVILLIFFTRLFILWVCAVFLIRVGGSLNRYQLLYYLTVFQNIYAEISSIFYMCVDLSLG